VELCDSVEKLRAMLAPARRSGATIGLVPTLGALHEGHLSHVRRARDECDVAVVSIFVNPLQFVPGEDYDGYPRTLDTDLAALAPLSVDAVFAPPREAFVPDDLATTVHVGGLTERLEGAHRPGHFDGVTTIVTKLLGAVQPDRAYFGEKDYQQLLVVRRMVDDLDLPVRIVAGPTVREPDGLAMSSRNAYLSPAEREQALALSAALFAARDAWDGDASSARGLLRRRLGEAPGVLLDYAEVCDPATLEPLEGVVTGPAQALVAARVGRARLIDNIRLDPPGAG
jgi:pantoate--beta-alanine ligase